MIVNDPNENVPTGVGHDPGGVGTIPQTTIHVEDGLPTVGIQCLHAYEQPASQTEATAALHPSGAPGSRKYFRGADFDPHLDPLRSQLETAPLAEGADIQWSLTSRFPKDTPVAHRAYKVWAQSPEAKDMIGARTQVPLHWYDDARGGIQHTILRDADVATADDLKAIKDVAALATRLPHTILDMNAPGIVCLWPERETKWDAHLREAPTKVIPDAEMSAMRKQRVIHPRWNARSFIRDARALIKTLDRSAKFGVGTKYGQLALLVQLNGQNLAKVINITAREKLQWELLTTTTKGVGTAKLTVTGAAETMGSFALCAERARLDVERHFGTVVWTRSEMRGHTWTAMALLQCELTFLDTCEYEGGGCKVRFEVITQTHSVTAQKKELNAIMGTAVEEAVAARSAEAAKTSLADVIAPDGMDVDQPTDSDTDGNTSDDDVVAVGDVVRTTGKASIYMESLREQQQLHLKKAIPVVKALAVKISQAPAVQKAVVDLALAALPDDLLDADLYLSQLKGAPTLEKLSEEVWRSKMERGRLQELWVALETALQTTQLPIPGRSFQAAALAGSFAPAPQQTARTTAKTAQQLTRRGAKPKHPTHISVRDLKAGRGRGGRGGRVRFS